MSASLSELASLAGTRIAGFYHQRRGELPWDKWFHKWSGQKQSSILTSLINGESDDPRLVTAMVKREVLIGMEFDGEEPSIKQPRKARLIHFYKRLAAQERFAPQFYAYQKAVGDVFDGRTSLKNDDDIRVVVSSALNQVDKGLWFTEAIEWAGSGATVIERDGAAWDATMNHEHLQMQLKSMSGVERDFRDFVESTNICRVMFKSQQAPAKCCDTYDDRFCYKLNGTTKSGHNDTSSRNSLINALITIASLRMVGITEARVIVIGDDMLCVIKGDVDLDRLMQYEYDCGITPVAAKFRGEAISRVEFASDAFAPAIVDGRHQYLAIPKLGKQWAKLFWTHRSVPAKSFDDYRYSVALGMASLVGRAKPYVTLLRSSLECKGRVISTGKWDYRVDNRVEFGPDFDDWLFQRYGVSTAEFEELDAIVRSISSVAYVLRHPVLDKIMSVDLADAVDRVLPH
jgi:hypothetical protein